MTENQKPVSNSDEIDLIELLAKIVIGFKNNSKFILGAFIAGTIIGLVYFQLVPKVYKSRMLINSAILTESYSKTITSDLSLLIKENNLITLSSKLSLSENQAASLTEIEVKSTIEKSDNIKEEEKNYLTIICRSKNNETWLGLPSGLINFFESNELVKVRVGQRKISLTQIIGKIDKELIDLNVLKEKIANGQMTNPVRKIWYYLIPPQ